MELLISARSDESGELNTTRCNLHGALTLGRGPDSPLLLDAMGISREHLRLHSDENRIFITDLSSNGTWLNDRRLARGEPHPLAPGDAIKIPGFQLRIAPQDTPAAAPAAPQTTAQPARVDGPLGALRNVGASLSKVERLLIAFALATLGLVVLYFTS